MAKPVLEEAIGRVYMSLLPERMAVVDLGCSSGPNTLEVVSEVLDVIGKLRRSLGRQEMPEILFFLNDLPGNDFNHVFRSLGDYKRKVEEEKGKLLVPYYVVGVPGSFYGRLFPCQSVHFFNASCCLNWLSQVPEGEQGVLLNNKNIYIAETSPLEVVKAYQEKHQRDLSEFLRCRHAELCYGARMVLSFPGSKGSYPPSGDVEYFFGLLAEALSAFVSQVNILSFYEFSMGIIEEDKLLTFNLPYYTPSMEEVKAVIHREDLFDLEQAQIFEANWDPFDDSAAFDGIVSGKNVAGNVRAAFQPFRERTSQSFHEGSTSQLKA
nr:PREDICTED: anthranilate O-methyltransferase 2-like [Musa acuminata subsp. malaccensis]